MIVFLSDFVSRDVPAKDSSRSVGSVSLSFLFVWMRRTPVFVISGIPFLESVVPGSGIRGVSSSRSFGDGVLFVMFVAVSSSVFTSVVFSGVSVIVWSSSWTFLPLPVPSLVTAVCLPSLVSVCM